VRGQAKFSRRIVAWYRRKGRTLPWRGIRDPYKILISEIMLQQTQVQRVLEKYPAFLKAFPTMGALASAPRAAVIRQWQGMGYNNRAVRLHLLAQSVVERFSGKLPEDYESLHALPGIGPYTARAVLYAAFGKREAIVDINVRRLFSRVFWRMPTTRSMRPEKEIWALAGSLLPKTGVYDWNQALMDLGATGCRARNPLCDECPVSEICRSRTRMKLTGNTPAAKEALYRGLPVRIRRGHIIEKLRNIPDGASLSLHGMAKKLFDPPAPEDFRWLEGVLRTLEKDGLVKLKRRGTTVRAALR
jgi:A/G-specific adenine glycosylase